MKQGRVLLANSTNTTSSSSQTTAVQAKDIASNIKQACESFTERLSLSLRPEPPPYN